MRAISSTHIAVDAAEYRIMCNAARDSFRLWERAQGYKRELESSAGKLRRATRQRNVLLVLLLLVVVVGVMGRFWE